MFYSIRTHSYSGKIYFITIKIFFHRRYSHCIKDMLNPYKSLCSFYFCSNLKWKKFYFSTYKFFLLKISCNMNKTSFGRRIYTYTLQIYFFLILELETIPLFSFFFCTSVLTIDFSLQSFQSKRQSPIGIFSCLI